MMEYILNGINSIWWLLVALLILVTLHEFGHFWVARKCGVGIRRFSVGFGKPIWMKTAADGTEYALAMIPLGGYVRMIDEREAAVKPSELPYAFNRKPVSQRIAIIAAGPIVNLIFAVFAFWLMFMVGVQDARMILGETTGIAEQAGLVEGDEIIAVDGEPVETITQANIKLMFHAIDRNDVELNIEKSDGKQSQHTISFSKLPDDFQEEKLFEASGLTIFQGRPIIYQLSEGGPAERVGLKPGDLITAINQVPISTFSEMREEVRKITDFGSSMLVEVQRNDQRFDVAMIPDILDENNNKRPIIGVTIRDPAAERFFTVFQYNPLDAVPAAFSELWRMTTATFGLIKRMVTGDASLRNLSGPITIADYARQSADLGLSRFLSFLALLSLSLGILNLLPIPLLDGGQLLYCFIELIKGSPVSESAQIAGQYVGLLMIGAMLSLTFYNDILRLLS